MTTGKTIALTRRTFVGKVRSLLLNMSYRLVITLHYYPCPKVKSESEIAQSCPTLCNPMDYSPWNFPGQNTGVDSLSLLQGIFPTQGSNPGLQHCRQILYQLSHEGSPGRKAMTNLESILKSRDVTLPTKVHLVKAMVFPVVMYGCERWTIKRAECQRIVFKLWCWRRLWRVPWTARDPTSHSYRK